jgi:3-deoxy-D-manno-octulosonic-acid transferase
MLVQGKYRESTLARLGFQTIPIMPDKKILWMHSVSLGESQISDQLAKVLKSESSEIYIVASSCTETGQKVLKNSKNIDFTFYYPADLYFLVKHIFTKIKPDLILIMETDLWPNMLKQADKNAVPVFLVNAKISDSTFSVYQKFPFLKQLLLDSIEHFFVQCQTYDTHFEKLGVDAPRRTLTGNLKLDRQYAYKSSEELDTLAKHLGLNRKQAIIVFASSHEGEEQGFINVSNLLRKTHPDLQVIFVPRHPERFNEVAALLKHNHISFNRSSDKNNDKCENVLVDQMGVLMDIYALSTISIVAGSFTEKVGGHNIFEPAFYAKPIIYGPWIFKQPGFHDLIQERHAAIQIQEQDWQVALEATILDLLSNVSKRNDLGKAALAIIEESQGISKLVVKALAKTNIPVRNDKIIK